MSRNLEQIGALPRVGDQYPLEEVSCVRCDVFGERERRGDNVLVQEIDVVALGIRWIVVEWQVASQHSVLHLVSMGRRTYLGDLPK